METDDRRNEFDMYGSRRRLTWFSREGRDGICTSDSVAGDDCPSIQKDSDRLAARILSESPARGGSNRTESPARKGESVRRIRGPSVEIDLAKASSNLLTSRRLRSIITHPPAPPIKEGSGVVNAEQKLIKPGRIAQCQALFEPEKKSSPEKKISSAKEDSTRRNGESPESYRMVVSYLAEETDRIIKARNLANIRAHSGALAVQPQTKDNETSSDAALPNSHRGRRPGASSFLESPFLTEQSICPPTMREGTGPPRTLSATMKKYLENRRTGTNMGTQIHLATRHGPAPSSTESPSNLPTLASELRNPSTSSKIGIGRYDHFNAPRAALSPLNGNEDVTHNASLPHGKVAYSAGTGEDPGSRRGSDFKSSVQMEKQDGFSGRFQHWAKSLGNGETTFNEDTRNPSQQAKDRPSAASGEERERKAAKSLPSNGTRENFSQDSRRVANQPRHPAARGHSQRIGEPGKSLLSEKILGNGSTHGGSRRTQSCRRESITNPLFNSTEEDQALPRVKTLSEFVFNTTADDNSSPRLPRNVPVENSLSSPCESFKDKFSILAKIDSARILRKEAADDAKVNVPCISLSFSESRRNTGKLTPLTDQALTLQAACQPFDQDDYKQLSLQSRMDTSSGRTDSMTSSGSISLASSVNSPRTNRRFSFPAAHLHKWLISQFKSGPKCKNGNSCKDLDLQDEKKQRNKSPWKSRPGEILQGITRKKGSKGWDTDSPEAPAAEPALDFQGLQALRLRLSCLENGTHSPISRSSLHRMMHDPDSGGNFTPARYSVSGGNFTPARWGDVGGSFTPARCSVDQQYHPMMQMEAGGKSTPGNQRLTPQHYRTLMENGGRSTPAHPQYCRVMQSVAAAGNSTPAHSSLDPQYNRMMHDKEGGGYSTPYHRKAYLLPPVPVQSPAQPLPPHFKGLQNLYSA